MSLLADFTDVVQCLYFRGYSREVAAKTLRELFSGGVLDDDIIGVMTETAYDYMDGKKPQ